MSRIDQIRAAFQAEQEAPVFVTKASEIPGSYDVITDEWLTAVICGDTPGAVVTGHQLDEPDDGTWNRRRMFIQYNDAGRAAGLPPSVFCKATHSLANRIMLSAGAAIGEVTFFRKLRPLLLDIDVPDAVFVNYDPDRSVAMVMMRDMASEVEFATHTTPMNMARAKSQLALLAKLHARFYDVKTLAQDFAELGSWHAKFNRLVDHHGLAEACDNGFGEAQEVIPPQLFARRAEIWPATMRAVDMHEELPQCLNHSDVHLRNWYVRPGDNMGLADWQAVCRGHWSRDVAYAISTALTVEDRRRWEQELIEYYLAQFAAAGGPAIDFDEAWLHYRQQLMSVLAWWTVTLTPAPDMPDMQPRDSTIEFLKRITHAMHDVGSLDAF